MLYMYVVRIPCYICMYLHVLYMYALVSEGTMLYMYVLRICEGTMLRSEGV